MPANVHLEIDQKLRKELEKQASSRRVSINALVKMILWAWWQGEREKPGGRG